MTKQLPLSWERLLTGPTTVKLACCLDPLMFSVSIHLIKTHWKKLNCLDDNSMNSEEEDLVHFCKFQRLLQGFAMKPSDHFTCGSRFNKKSTKKTIGLMTPYLVRFDEGRCRQQMSREQWCLWWRHPGWQLWCRRCQRLPRQRAHGLGSDAAKAPRRWRISFHTSHSHWRRCRKVWCRLEGGPLNRRGMSAASLKFDLWPCRYQAGVGTAALILSYYFS